MRVSLVLSLVLSLAAIVLSLPAEARPATAPDSCDRLTARIIRATGASLAGREGSRAVFRAEDADRMSLECRAPPRMAFGSRHREPAGGYFVLIGLAAEGFTGAKAGAVEILARDLHQDSLLTGMARTGRAGRAALRCEAGGQAIGQSDAAPVLTRCVLVPHRPPALRRRAGLFPGRQAG